MTESNPTISFSLRMVLLVRDEPSVRPPRFRG
jgi:hypothetical protein